NVNINIEKVSFIALVIISENSLSNAAKICRGLINKKSAEEYYKINFFIEENKDGLIKAVYGLIKELDELKELEKLKLNPFNFNNIEFEIKKYKKLSDGSAVKFLLGYFDYIIFFLAVGAVVRLIAPYLKNKYKDPGIITVDEAGKFAVSLLSGHIGGANRFAEEISGYLENSIPVITTATDSQNKFSIDAFAEKFDFYIEDAKEKVKHYNEASLNGESFEIILEDNFKAGGIKLYVKNFNNAERIRIKEEFDFKNLRLNPQNFNDKHKIIIVTIKKDLNGLEKSKNIAVLRPKRLVLGIGCNRNTGLNEIEDFVSEILEKNDVVLNSVRNIASINNKKNERGLLDFGFKYGRFIDFYSKDEINAFIESFASKNKTVLPEYLKSPSFKYTGAYSVCEPCAAMSAKNYAAPLIPKQKKGNVTVSAAVIEDVIEDIKFK
ncbi:MAG: cobalt-precorrin 5A hydrolase, partial [Candidatus Acidulodesulfobacterium sp.]